MTKNIFLLRHASTGEEKLVFKGIANAPLSEKGRREAAAMREKFRLENISFDAVFSSPLSRAADTALLASGLTAEAVRIHRGLTDINCGDWEARSVEAVKQEEPGLFEIWMKRPAEFAFPGGESVEGAALRARRFLDEVIQNPGADNLLVVTHRLIINVMVLGALNIDLNNYWRFRYDNCSYSVLCYDGSFYLRAMNLK
ncbi:MAG TPA: histidine phosphatase family protein [Candidatus Wallbacteria bacterium]|nr:histidine phosphatase family protein [Candidatus Wallbacteria bacterium]